MIKCEKGRTTVKGSGKELLTEYIDITNAMREIMGDEMAEEILPAAVKYVLEGMVESKVIESSVSEGAVS